MADIVNMFFKNLIEHNDYRTALGIGPMSSIVVRATFELALTKNFPVMFIASRNQIDAELFGSGYVHNWTQKSFTREIDSITREIGYKGVPLICQDHGGPWQRDEEYQKALPLEQAMSIAKKSFLEDITNGFNVIHIDPTKDPHVNGFLSIEDVIVRTVELIEYIEVERKKRSISEVMYEVGTEETNGGLTTPETYEAFIRSLTRSLREKRLPLPTFIVGQTGTLTRFTENVGGFSHKNANLLSAIAKKYSVGLKEHNADYLNDSILLDHPNLGVSAINVAPEFGVIETRAYLILAELEEHEFKNGCLTHSSGFTTALTRKAIEHGKWKKWVDDDIRVIDIDTIIKNSELSKKLVEMSGHYVLYHDDIEKTKEHLLTNLRKLHIDAEKYIIEKIKTAIYRYVLCLNLEDSMA